MSRYIDLNGVHSWYDVQGAGEPVVLLHPAAVDSRVFDANIPALIPHFQVFTYDRRGHGRTRDVDGPIGVLDTDAEPPDFMAASYGEVSPDGIEHYPVLIAKLARMHDEEPRLTAEDLAKVTCRTLVMLGDDDEVRLEHAIELYRTVPDGELAIVPGTSHGLLVEKPDLCNRIIAEFLTTDPVPTFAPIHRRST